MTRTLCRLLVCLSLVTQMRAAELFIGPESTPLKSFPAGFTSYLAGGGPPADWKVLMDALPSAMTRVSPLATQSNRKKVIGQFSEVERNGRNVMLVYDGETFEDFTLTSRVKAVGGHLAQTLGIVFRWQDADNYYSFRIDALEGWFYFRKVVNGQSLEPIGNRLKIPSNTWHSISIECKGPRISLRLNESDTIPVLTDTQFSAGKIGYWTEADTVAYFGDTRVIYRPKIARAQSLVEQVMKKYDRLVQVSIYATESDKAPATLIASNLTDKIGTSADDPILDSIARGKIYYAKTKKTAIITLPIKDRNGESMAACRVELKRFKGQTQSNAIVRAMPVVEMIQARVLDRRDLFD